MASRQWWRPRLDGLHGYLALVSFGLLVVAVSVSLTRLGSSNPFVWAVVSLAATTPVGYWPRPGARDTGALLARGGVVISLLAAQIEIGSGPKFYRAAGDWLVVAVAFAVAALVIHLLSLHRRRAEAAELRAREEASARCQEQRHQKLLSIIAHSSELAASRPRRILPAVAMVAGVAVGALLSQTRQRDQPLV